MLPHDWGDYDRYRKPPRAADYAALIRLAEATREVLDRCDMSTRN
jgi:hypothetical protein